MTGTKQILLAGFAALCMVLPACRSTSESGSAETPPLVVASVPLNSVSYFADYTQDGAPLITCEVLMGSDKLIRRNYAWKDEDGADRKLSIVINDGKEAKIENGRISDAEDSSATMARFFAGLVLKPGTVVSGASGIQDARTLPADEFPGRICLPELAGVPGVESCVVATDPENDRWSSLTVRMAGESGAVVSSRFHEYKTDSGVTYPSRIVSSTEGGASVQCVIRDVKINPELPDELFRLPETNG